MTNVTIYPIACVLEQPLHHDEPNDLERQRANLVGLHACTTDQRLPNLEQRLKQVLLHEIQWIVAVSPP